MAPTKKVFEKFNLWNAIKITDIMKKVRVMKTPLHPTFI